MAFFEYLVQELDDFLNSRIKPIACKSSGAYFPDPKNYSNANNRNKAVSPNIDASGSLQTRSQILTDEKIYRNDFTISNTKLTGTINFTNNSKIVTGTNSKFLSELNIDQYIKSSLNADSYYSLIDYIVDDNNLFLKNNYTYTTSSDGYNNNYYPIIQNGSITTSNSICKINSGTITNSLNGIFVDADNSPLIATSYMYISQRIANQDSYFGFVDNYSAPSVYAMAVFDGTDNTKVKFRTSSSSNSNDLQETLTTIRGATTSSYFNIKVLCNQQCCSLYIDNICLATHSRHIPDSFTNLSAFCAIKNKAVVANTSIFIDTLYINSCDKIEITNTFNDNPVPVIYSEEINILTGKLITTATTANQVILSYTVPSNSNFYVKGYYITSSGNTNGDPVIFGRNSLTEISSPGGIYNEVFRVFYLLTKTNYSETFSSPVLIGSDGDVIKIVVTPTGAGNTTWRASVDFILRT